MTQSTTRGTSGGSTPAALASQVYQVFIKASPERIWEAITQPEFTERYFFGARITNTPDAHRSFGPTGESWGEGAVSEFDPPHRLSHEWRSLYDPGLGAEPASRVTWEIEPQDGGFCKLTVTHDRLDDSPRTAQSVSGEGWMFVLSGLKTLLETGQPLGGAS